MQRCSIVASYRQVKQAGRSAHAAPAVVAFASQGGTGKPFHKCVLLCPSSMLTESFWATKGPRYPCLLYTSPSPRD